MAFLIFGEKQCHCPVARLPWLSAQAQGVAGRESRAARRRQMAKGAAESRSCRNLAPPPGRGTNGRRKGTSKDQSSVSASGARLGPARLFLKILSFRSPANRMPTELATPASCSARKLKYREIQISRTARSSLMLPYSPDGQIVDYVHSRSVLA
jgi:hypothetical protein